MQPLTDPTEFDALGALPTVLVYKHSTRCPISMVAHSEVERLAAAHPEVPVRIVDVIAHRALSRHIAQQTGVMHHSPQLILLVNGEPVWDVSHFDIRATELGDRLEGAATQ